MAITIISVIVLLVVVILITVSAVFLYSKYAEYKEFKAKVVDISNHVMIINTFEPGMWGVIICEEDNGQTHCFTTNLGISDTLIKGKDYIFVTCNDKLLEVRNVE